MAIIFPELIKLIEEYSPVPLPEIDVEEVDLYDNLGIRGDDADELMQEYRARFGVSLAGFDLDNHFPREGEEILPSLAMSPPWMKIREYEPLTIGDLQRGIERKYLGLDPATVATMHAPLSPEEEQGVEDAVFSLKNRLIYKPFFIITILSMSGSVVFHWLVVGVGLMSNLWFLPLFIIHQALVWIFVAPRVSLLQPAGWMEDRRYDRLQAGAMGLLSLILPIIIPSALLFRYFDGGGDGLLVWAVIVFLAGLFAFLAFIHTYPFNPQKLKEFARDKGIDITALKLK